MYCNNCGTYLADSASFCTMCGVRTVLPDNAFRKHFSTRPGELIQPKRSPLLRNFVIAGGVLLILFLALGLLIPSGSNTVATQEQSPTLQSTSADHVLQHADPKLIIKAQKLLREKWATETQQELWRQGTEMTLEAQGTTLYIKYDLAGNAFAYQFQDQFLRDNADMLKTLGFKKAQLSNGEQLWSWDIDKIK